jgi:hypothetical protein
MFSLGRVPLRFACAPEGRLRHAWLALLLLVGCSSDTFGTMRPGAVLPGEDAAIADDASSDHDDEDATIAPPPTPGSDASIAECVTLLDCASAEAFQCLQGVCVEYACHPQKPCAGTEVCEDHACVPFVPPERFPAGFYQSSGGGTASNTQFHLRLSAGAPQPMRSAQSSKYKLTLGAGAGRP